MTTHAEMWDTSAHRLEPEAVYAERWSLVRLILEAGEGRSIPPKKSPRGGLAHRSASRSARCAEWAGTTTETACDTRRMVGSG
jgi:hypothetical protein